MTSASLIISVYKKIEELNLVLNALSLQSCKDFEVIISDDGSGIEMEKFITTIKNKFDFKINFVSQEDKGFRKTRILNNAIKRSKTDYLIFIDGDCIPHKNFIKYHLLNKAENTVLYGRRVMLGKKISNEIKCGKIPLEKLSKIKLKLLFDSFKKDESSYHIEESFIIKNKLLRNIYKIKSNHLSGCNYSLPKCLIEEINGFDENYIGPGIGEDSDIEFRLKQIGAKFKSVRNLAIVYHLYHPKTITSKSNLLYFNSVLQSKQYFCKNGLKKV
ncbi:MAG: glycosyltransferase [Ignavibacteria bacterium]|nr:glycosyltransferase [Ignavibacteria bacterium]